MRLRNSTDYPDRFLRRLVSWCAREAELPPSMVRAAQFTRTRASFRGRAWSSMRILVRIGDEHHFPLRNLKYPGLVRAPVYDLADRLEALVQITAHEIEHLYDFSQGIRIVREGSVDFRSLKSLDKFRANRDALLAEWSEPTASDQVEAKPRKSIVDQRAELAAERLAYWESRLKLAKTKVAKYRRRVNYYAKKKAPPPPPATRIAAKS